MKKAIEIALGIMTSIGGFLEVGAITTTAQAGAHFGFRLGWALLLGTICLIFLVEMSGRLAAVSGHTYADALRERFGANFFVIPLVVVLITNLLVLAAEIGGMSVAIELVSGASFRWFVVPCAVIVWLLLWRGTFGLIEKGVALLGLVSIAFVVGLVRESPPYAGIAAGLLPSLPGRDQADYWYLAVAILGAAVSPYVFAFYSSGAIEERWGVEHVRINRAVAAVGMLFGAVIGLAIMALCAVVLEPRGIRVETFGQAAQSLVHSLGRAGLYLFAATLFICCMGAALELALGTAYMLAQGFGWNWGENLKPSADARFSVAYTIFILLAMLVMLSGVKPLGLTVLSMALTSATLPVTTFPFLILLNDPRYMKRWVNGRLSNAVLVVTILLASLLAIVTIPLQLITT